MLNSLSKDTSCTTKLWRSLGLESIDKTDREMEPGSPTQEPGAGEFAEKQGLKQFPVLPSPTFYEQSTVGQVCYLP